MLNVSRSTAYVILAFAILLEVAGDALLEACNGYQNMLLAVASILLLAVSLFVFAKILHIINLAVAYATWSAVGALLSVFIGIIFFGQHLTPIGWASVIAMSVGTVVLDLWGTPKEDEK